MIVKYSTLAKFYEKNPLTEQDFFSFYESTPTLQKWEYAPIMRRIQKDIEQGSYDEKKARTLFEELVSVAEDLRVFATGIKKKFPEQVRRKIVDTFMQRVEKEI